MCRWFAYSGAPIYVEEVIVKPEHSLIDQSQRAQQRPGLSWGSDQRNYRKYLK